MKCSHYSICLAVLLAIAGYLGFAGLSKTDLWCDEAYVATGAGDLLSTGSFIGWDGRNLNGFRNGAAVDDNLRPVNAPLDIYVCAAAFKVLGRSVWSARVPFVLMGLLSIWLFARLMVVETRDRRFALLAVGMLVFSVAYLLYIRQARYYSLSVAGALLVLVGYRGSLAARSWWPVVLLALGGVIGFYANPMVCAIVYVALAVGHFSTYNWTVTRRAFLRFAAGAWLFLLATLPYTIYFRAWLRPDHNFEADPWMIARLKLLWWNVRDVLWTSPLPYVLLPFVVVFLVQARRGGLRGRLTRRARFWAIFAGAYLLLLVLVSPQPTVIWRPADVRYQAAIYPVLAALAAVGVYWIWGRSRVTAVAAVVVATCVIPWKLHPERPGFQWLLPAYLREIHAGLPTASAEVTKYLSANAHDNDTLFSTPEYMNYGVNFSLGDRLLLAGVLNERTHLSARVVKSLPERLQLERVEPEWIVVYGITQKSLLDTERYLRPKDAAGNAQPSKYQNVLSVPMLFREIQRPELTDHFFEQPGVSRAEEGVLVFRKE